MGWGDFKWGRVKWPLCTNGTLSTLVAGVRGLRTTLLSSVLPSSL